MNPTSFFPHLFAQNSTPGSPIVVEESIEEVEKAAQNLETGKGSPIPYVTADQWKQLEPYIWEFGLNLLIAVLILLLGWILAKVISGSFRRFLQTQEHLDITVSLLISRMISWAIMLLAVAAVAQLFNLGASMFAAIGAAGLAIALALKDTMSNVASGVMLLVIRPFNVGDAVKLGSEVFIVEEIGLFSVTAHLPDGPRAMIPNSKITAAETINYAVCHDDVRRLDLTVGIGYEDDINQAFEVLNKILDADERVLNNPARLLAVSEMADSSVNLLVRCWTKRTDWWHVKCDLTKAIKLTLDEAGINIPFPQQDVHVVSGGYGPANGSDGASAPGKTPPPAEDPLQLPLAAKPEPAQPAEPMTEAKRWSSLRFPASN